MKLKKIQEEFCNYILSRNIDSDAKYLEENIIAGKIGKRKTLDIYKNNYHQSMIKNLSSIFPTLLKLVGEDFFAQIVINYSTNHPPKTGVLLEYGKDFPNFIATIPNLEKLPYLEDVALLDWLINLSHHAPANCNPIHDIYNTLIERQCFDKCYLKIAQNVQLMHSPYAIDLIYNFCNNDAATQEKELDYTKREANIIIFKVVNKTNVMHLNQIAFEFLQLVKAKKTFANILESLLELHAEQKIINDLQKIFNLPIFSGFDYTS